MKKFLFILFIFNSVLLYSQNKQLFSVYLNSGVATGSNFTEVHLGFDLEARNGKFGVFFNSAYHNQPHGGVIEFTLGPRWYIGKLNKVHGTIEPGIGFYTNSDFRSRKIGINLGGGVNYPIASNIDLNLKLRYHLLGAYFENSYGETYFGIRYYFNK